MSSTEPLADLARALRSATLQSLFDGDAARADRLSLAFRDWRIDLSKERVTPAVVAALVAQAESVGLAGWIGALRSGEKINLSEGRAVLHTALREQHDRRIDVDGADIVPQIRDTQRRMRDIATAIRDGTRRGATGEALDTVVNIGIGGSDLGPRLVCEALAEPGAPGPRVVFVSNVDPEHITRAVAGRDPRRTLFIVTSKTFTTQETLANANAARAWLAAGLGDADIASHFVAVTSNVAAAQAFGVAADAILPMWDWVGGRYSLWSAVGLPIAIACGYDAFARLLEGAAAMDDHFAQAPFAQNAPVVLGLVGWWNACWLGIPQRVVVPYAHALGRLPAFLQQLSLESNGKRVTRDGRALAGPSAPSLWGEVGTDGQHAFFQWLHQGTHPVPVEFVVPVRARHPVADQQTLLVANALAQAQALLVGRAKEDIRRELQASLAGDALEAAVAARHCPGDRPSTMLLLPEIDAFNLGALLALYEHRTFVEGVMLGINSFDQWGVELGKTLAKPLIAALACDAPLPLGTDASTRALVAHARRLGVNG